MNSKLREVLDDLHRIEDDEKVYGLVETIDKLVEIIDENELSLDDVKEWCETDPESVAYLTKFGSVQEQEWGDKLITAILRYGNQKDVSPTQKG